MAWHSASLPVQRADDAVIGSGPGSLAPGDESGACRDKNIFGRVLRESSDPCPSIADRSLCLGATRRAHEERSALQPPKVCGLIYRRNQ